MKKLASGVFVMLCSTTALAGTHWDGATNMVSYQDPYFSPEDDPVTGESYARFGVISFNYSSVGQVNDGWVTPWVVMDPDDNYESFMAIHFTDGANPDGHGSSDIDVSGYNCPLLKWTIDNQMGGNGDGSLDADQLDIWLEEGCSNRPAPDLYNSGNNMGLELILNSRDQSRWMVMSVDNELPMDGGKYNVQIYYSTGTPTHSPWAKFIVSTIGQPGSGVLSDFVYVDSSYYYPGNPGMPFSDGFSVPLSGAFWQFGCQTRDANWIDTCVTGTFDNFFLYPTNDETSVLPYNTTAGLFFTPAGFAADLGHYCALPFSFPPEVCLQGTDWQFVFNAADNAAGIQIPQTYTPTGWQQKGDNNPNYQFLGGTIYASFDFY